jgi:DNA-binding NtrC family response regulator
MVKKILVADDSLDAHELVHDILQISFKQVKIDRAMTGAGFMKKIEKSKNDYDLILFNIRMKQENGEDVFSFLQAEYPDLMERVVLLADSPEDQESSSVTEIPCLSKPFSLDYFGEVVKKVCND